MRCVQPHPPLDVRHAVLIAELSPPTGRNIIGRGEETSSEPLDSDRRERRTKTPVYEMEVPI